MKSGTSGAKDSLTCPCAATLLTDVAGELDRMLDELHGIQSGQSYAAALEWTSRLRAGLDALESLAVRDAVLNAHLSKTEIASALGITRQTLYNRHKELFGELKEQCRRKPRHPIDSTAYRIRDGRTIPAKEKE